MNELELTNEQYHALTDSISSSGIKLILKSPKHFWNAYMNPDKAPKASTDAMDFGTLVHSMVLEPKTVQDKYQFVPNEIDRRTKVGKELFQQIEANGKMAFKEKEYCEAMAMATAVLNHPDASVIKAGIGAPERSFFWEEETDYGVITCKMRPDWCIEPCEALESGFIGDLKTTKDCTPDAFARDAYNLGYYISAALYCRGFQKFFKAEEPPIFMIWAAEKEDPYGVVSHVFDDEFLELGWQKCKEAMNLYAKCLYKNEWPCYTTDCNTISKPKWARG